MQKLRSAAFLQPVQVGAAILTEISKIRGLVGFGDMAVESATVPLEDIQGDLRGYYRHEVRCNLCGQRFAVWYDTSDGSGGLAPERMSTFPA